MHLTSRIELGDVRLGLVSESKLFHLTQTPSQKPAFFSSATFGKRHLSVVGFVVVVVVGPGGVVERVCTCWLAWV